MNHRNLTEELASLIVNTDLSSNIAAKKSARLGIIDYLASSFAAADNKSVLKLWNIVNSEGGNKEVPIIGQRQKASFLQAGLLNGYIGHVLDYDDVHEDVRGHPSTVILPSLLSGAATHSVTGERFLGAYIIGVEVMARLGKAVGVEHYIKGWHNTATLGSIAAAVAVGYLKDFSQIEMQKVIGFAATQASGLRTQFGTEAKPLHAGLAAQNALLAIRCVEENISGTETALDEKSGFFSVYGDLSLAEVTLTKDWGKTWRIVDPGLWFKVYPFCSAAHHAADATKILMKEYTISATNIESIDVVFPSNGDAALIESSPTTGEQGRFSVEYVVSLLIYQYSLSLENFKDSPILQDVASFLPKVHRVYDDSIIPAPNAVPKNRFTIVKIKMIDGTLYEQRIDCPKGAPGNALSQYDLEFKLYESLPSNSLLAQQLIDLINKFHSENHVLQFLSLLNSHKLR